MGRFELSANVLYVFVVAFCVLQLRTCCLYLRSIFYLNILALLHRCYMRGYGIVGLVLLSCCRFLAKSDQILDVVCFMACCLNRLGMDVLVTCVISFCYCPLMGSCHVWPGAAQQEAHR